MAERDKTLITLENLSDFKDKIDEQIKEYANSATHIHLYEHKIIAQKSIPDGEYFITRYLGIIIYSTDKTSITSSLNSIESLLLSNAGFGYVCEVDGYNDSIDWTFHRQIITSATPDYMSYSGGSIYLYDYTIKSDTVKETE